MEYAVFRLIDNQRYALKISNVVEVVSASEMSEIPGSDDSTVGVTSLRGEVISIKSPHVAVAHINKEDSLKQNYWLVIENGDKKVILLNNGLEGIVDIDDSSWDSSELGTTVVSRVCNHKDGLIQELSLDSFFE